MPKPEPDIVQRADLRTAHLKEVPCLEELAQMVDVGLLEAKLLFAAASFACALLGCCLAKKISAKEGESSDLVLLLGTALASGVLLAASIVHMLPDAMGVLSDYFDFPLAPFLAGCAYCLLVFISEVLGDCMPKRDEKEPEKQTQRGSVTYEAALWPPWSRRKIPGRDRSDEANVDTDQAPSHEEEGFSLVAGIHIRGTTSDATTDVAVEIKSLVLFAALSFHSLMEGLGLGSADDSGALMSVAIAILAHKGLAAFALGTTLARSELPSWKFWTYVLIFSLGTPLGCVLGAVVVGNAGEADQSFASAVCISLASGTFLQVSTLELLPLVLAEEGHKAASTICLSVGFVCMGLLAIWV